MSTEHLIVEKDFLSIKCLTGKKKPALSTGWSSVAVEASAVVWRVEGTGVGAGVGAVGFVLVLQKRETHV